MRFHTKTGFGFLGLLASLALPAAASAQGPTCRADEGASVCLAPEKIADVNDCSTASAFSRESRELTRAPVTSVQTDTTEAKSQWEGPQLEINRREAAGIDEVHARGRDFLEREVRLLENLIRNMRADNADRPNYLLRLAETYFEYQLALNVDVRSFDEPIFQACNVKKDQQACAAARQGQKTAEERLEQARAATNRTYARLVQDHPDFPRMDEVLFKLAFGLDQMGEVETARQVYLRLIKDFPESRFIPSAYLSFAEFYFAENEASAALQFYSKVLEYPADRNPVYGYALYKTAWVHYNLQDFKAALQAFVDTIEFAEKNKDATDASNLARQARREMILPYSRVGSPNRALPFFKRYATDEDQAYQMLETLADLYFDTGQWTEAIATYHRLMAERPDSHSLCKWQTQITQATIPAKPKPEIVRELERMVGIYNKYIENPNRPAKELKECKGYTAGVLYQLATQWHVEAVGDPTKDSSGTQDRGTMESAASLYQLLVDSFPDMETLEFPNIGRDSWPSLYRVAYFQAELLWTMKDWERCGPAFDKVVRLDPNGEFTADAAYAAVMCYNNLYTAQWEARERETQGPEGEVAEAKGQYEPREMTELESRMEEVFKNYICVVGDDADDLAQIKYRRARIFYEANQHEKAAVLFRDIAFSHRNTEYAEYAANLYLDSLSILGTQREEPITACIIELEKNVQPMTEEFCSKASDRHRFDTLCPVLDRLECQVKRKRAELMQECGEYREAGLAYVEMFRDNIRRAPEDQCGAMDEILYNAAINFEAAYLIGQAVQVRQVLIDQYPESKLAQKAIYLIGANFHALAFYENAAVYYERFAKRYSGEIGQNCTDGERAEGRCPNAIEALKNATLFRLGLNQEEEALDNVKVFARAYGKSRPDDTVTVAYAMGQLYVRRNQPYMIIQYYRTFLRDYRRTMRPHEQVNANLHIARAFVSLDRGKDADTHYGEIIKLWNRGAAKAIADNPNMSDAEKMVAIRQILDATGEAKFREGEALYAAFRNIRFPALSGARTFAKVNEWATKNFAPFITRKQQALVKAEEKFNEIAGLRVELGDGVVLQTPPWQIAAAARSGMMYREFVDSFFNAPVPEEIERDPELYRIYLSTIEDPAAPLVETAKQRFLFCLNTATNVRWFNEWSTACEAELHQLDPRSFPMAAEIRGTPGYAYGTPGRPGAIELGLDDEGDIDATGGTSNESASAGEGT
ncbi:MAG: tetratricopeptide repeat protein [Sandaracinaceae bacterium]|nr:tetratricopeptide repeat protein [Sandaracinaceae bacterium]